MFRHLIVNAIHFPRRVMWVTALLALVAVLQLPRIQVDTDPENMLPEDAAVRVFHHEIKKEFSVYDFIVLGVINEEHPEGVFNPRTLTHVFEITEQIKRLEGVIASELIAPSTKDNIEQADIGTVRFNWLMEEPPSTSEAALKIRDEARDHPLFYGTLVSEDGRALALYVPIERKDISYDVARKIESIVQQYPGDAQYHITGLPVAEDQFGVEMFKQMAISAPLAGIVIFLLMWFFFRSLPLIIAPMLVAVATVVITMGTLIGFGFPVHIMSSMIPIFLMPIAVLDSVHILSEFFDKYPQFKERRKTLFFVMDELFTPMLFTTLTSMAGFFSLSFSPIPPVQVFGVFVAVGVGVAWILTITFIPAYVMLLKGAAFQGFGRVLKEEGQHGMVDQLLGAFNRIAVTKYKLVLTAAVCVVLVSVYGISRIQVNDNPVRWFTAAHPIRVADRILNEHFGGTYEAYLVMETVQGSLEESPEESSEEFPEEFPEGSPEVFLDPEMLRYVERLQAALAREDVVGKSTSLADIVKKIYYELLGGDKVNNVIPPSREAVAQCLISFENSHKPDDLWHFTTPDYSKLNIWVQLKSGDNKDMARVAAFVENYMKENSPPIPLTARWAGLTYINVIWQNNMVGGMLKNFLGSFIIVLFMMLFLFRSPVKAIISMVPLSITILLIYGILGLVGKDYDMPVAVLSALTLGLSVDFAIHFIQRAVEINDTEKNWEKTAWRMSGGPGRAIIRNALVVAIGFLPLLAAPLIPYKTVGFFMFMIMAVSSVVTLLILPAIISVKPDIIFGYPKKGMSCHCGYCILIALFVSSAVAYVLFGYSTAGWQTVTFVTIGIVGVFAAICHFASQRKICISEEEKS